MIDGEALEKAWCAETSYWPEKWTEDNPALGQCAITALLVQDYLGGLIVVGKVGRSRHYWNELHDHQLDLTFGQFPEGSKAVDLGYVVREKLLRTESTRTRYLLLKDRYENLR